MPKIFDCACGAADKDEGNADGNADADDDHLYQETGGRAPRQLCCIAVTVYIAISKHCHIKCKISYSSSKYIHIFLLLPPQYHPLMLTIIYKLNTYKAQK